MMVGDRMCLRHGQPGKQGCGKAFTLCPGRVVTLPEDSPEVPSRVAIGF